MENKRGKGNTKGCDMIAGLTRLPAIPQMDGEIRLKRAFPGDKEEILTFITEHFNKNWTGEAEKAILQEPGKCFIATRKGKLLGFACFDATAKGFFGPIGVAPEKRGSKIGAALLIRTLEAMRESGYAYAIIGWVDDAERFYRKLVNAEFIPGGEPENSVYSNLIKME